MWVGVVDLSARPRRATDLERVSAVSRCPRGVLPPSSLSVFGVWTGSDRRIRPAGTHFSERLPLPIVGLHLVGRPCTVVRRADDRRARARRLLVRGRGREQRRLSPSLLPATGGPDPWYRAGGQCRRNRASRRH